MKSETMQSPLSAESIFALRIVRSAIKCNKIYRRLCAFRCSKNRRNRKKTFSFHFGFHRHLCASTQKDRK